MILLCLPILTEVLSSPKLTQLFQLIPIHEVFILADENAFAILESGKISRIIGDKWSIIASGICAILRNVILLQSSAVLNYCDVIFMICVSI